MAKEKEKDKKKAVYMPERKSLWDRIKGFFSSIRDRLEFMMLPKAQKEAINKQMMLSLERGEKAQREQEEKIQKERPSKLYNRYLSPKCELSKESLHDRISKMSYDVLEKGKDASIDLPNGSKLEMKPDSEKMRTFINVYKDNELQFTDGIQFMTKRGAVLEDVKNSSVSRLERLLSDKETFISKGRPVVEMDNNIEMNQDNPILEKIEAVEKNLADETKDIVKKTHLEYVQTYSDNHFSLNPAQLTNMVKLMVQHGLDKNDEKKFSRTVVIKNQNKNEPDVKIKASWDKENKCTKITYLKDKQEITEKEMIEAWKDAKDVKYTIPDWEKEAVIQKIPAFIPEYSLNENKLIKSLATAYTMNVQDMQNSDYPPEVKDMYQNAVEKGDMKMLSQLYNCFTSYAGDATNLQFHKSQVVIQNMEEKNINLYTDYGVTADESIIANMALAIDYTKKILDLPYPEQHSPELDYFLRERALAMVVSIDRMSDQTRTAVGHITGDIDITEYKYSLEGQFNISYEDRADYSQYGVMVREEDRQPNFDAQRMTEEELLEEMAINGFTPDMIDDPEYKAQYEAMMNQSVQEANIQPEQEKQEEILFEEVPEEIQVTLEDIAPDYNPDDCIQADTPPEFVPFDDSLEFDDFLARNEYETYHGATHTNHIPTQEQNYEYER